MTRSANGEAGGERSGTTMSVVLGLWQDRPPEENVAVGRLADELGYPELWIGEMATYDAFALATAIAGATEQIGFTIGPLSVHARTPMTVAVGAASVATLTGRPVDVALGTSSDVVVERWHGLDRSRPAQTLEDHAVATAELLSGRKADLGLETLSTSGYRLRLPAPGSGVTVAAFGPRAIGVAARVADRLVLNMVTPAAARRLSDALATAADDAGRPRPTVAAWLPAAIDPRAETLQQITMGLVAYLAAPGYGEMFAEAGFADLVDFARTRPHPKELFAAVPADLIDAIGLIGSASDVADRMAEYAAAGVDEICLVPATAGDAADRTLRTLAPS